MYNEDAQDEVSITVIATGIKEKKPAEQKPAVQETKSQLGLHSNFGTMPQSLSGTNFLNNQRPSSPVLTERLEVPLETQGSGALRTGETVDRDVQSKARLGREGGLEIPDFLRRK